MRSEWKGSAEGNEAIERVLAGLRAVEVPEGMDRRVLGRVQSAAEEKAGASGRWGGLVQAPVVVAVMLLVVAGVGVRWLGRGMGIGTAGRAVVPARQVGGMRGLDRTGVGDGTEVARLPGTGVAVSGRRVAAERAERLRRVSAAEGGGGVAELTVEEEARREETVTAAEMRAPTTVAPLLPLTKEERLLQRAAQRGGADEMAALTEEERAKEGAASRAAFREFFGPSRSEAAELEAKGLGESDATN